MTNTKWLSALLAGTALTVASTAAMADTSLVTMTRNAAGEGVTFSVAPTADMPASATEITVGGRVRTELWNEDYQSTGHFDGDRFGNDSELYTDAALFMSGKTDTSVGQVRAFVNMYFTDNNTSSITYAGEWDFAPGFTLVGGYTTTLDGGTMGYGADIGTWLAGSYGTAGAGDHANEIMGVRYSTGPASFALGMNSGEDSGEYDVTGQAKMDFGFGSIGASFISGEESDGDEGDDGYTASVGAMVMAGEQLSFSGAYTMSDGRSDYYSHFGSWKCDDEGEECSAVSLGAAYTMGDVKFSAGYSLQSDHDDDSYTEMRASVAWSATPKLTIVGQLVNQTNDYDSDETNVAGVGAWFRF
jgi:hypothetical protein